MLERRWQPLVLGMLLVFVFFLNGCTQEQDSGSRAADFGFTLAHATNAYNKVAELISGFTPRDAGTPGAKRAAEWLDSELRTSGLDTRIDSFIDLTPRGSNEFYNVIATIPGRSAECIILLSHFDTMSGIGGGFEGANDSGSSTGLLLELARILQAQAPHPYTIICGFMDGEECMVKYGRHDGFHGSKYFARQVKRTDIKVRAVLLTDMIGDRDLHLQVPRNSSASLRLLALEAAEATGNRHKISLFDSNIYDDHQAFLDRGFPAVNLIDFEFGSAPGKNDYWHTPQDTMDKISPESFHVTGQIVMEMLRRLLQE